MSDNLTVFSTNYTGVTGIKAKGTGNGMLTYIRPQGTKSISANGTGIDVAAYSMVDVAVQGGGGDTYTLTTIVPEQTFTAQEMDNSYQVNLTYTAGLEDGEEYLVTLDGEQYICRCGIMWGNDYMAGTISYLWEKNSNDVYPFGLDYVPGTNEFSVGVPDLNQHTIKVEHIEFVDGPLNLIAKSITANGTYNASSDNADGYSSVTVNVPTGGNDFVVTLSYNDQTEMWEPDYTYSETYAAYQAGKAIVAYAGSYNAATIGYDSGDGCFYYSVRDGFDEPNGTSYYNYGIDSHDYIWESSGVGSDLTMRCYATDGANAAPSDVAQGKRFFNASGIQTGTASGGTYQTKTNISPTTSSQTIRPDSGYDALSSVQINAMPSGTAGTPTATKGTVSNHSITVTPSVTNTTGYITGSTKTGTAVTVSASELVSGSETKTANGTYNVTNLASLVVNIPIVTYHTSSSAPTSSQGSNGDLWLVTA